MVRIQKKKAARMLQEALLLGGQSRWLEARDVAARIVHDSDLVDEMAYWCLAMGHKECGEPEKSREILELGLTMAEGPMLLGALGQHYIDVNRAAVAIPYFEKALSQKRRDPSLLARHAEALLMVGEVDAAERQVAAALLVGGGIETRILLAMVKTQRGLFDEAEAIALHMENESKQAPLKAIAKGLRAGILLEARKSAAALSLYLELDADGALPEHDLSNAAYAAQKVGDTELANRFLERSESSARKDEDEYRIALTLLLQGKPQEALGRLEKDGVSTLFEVCFQSESVRAQVLAACDRSAEALPLAQRAASRHEADSMGYELFLTLAKLEEHQGDSKGATRALERARLIDPAAFAALKLLPEEPASPNSAEELAAAGAAALSIANDEADSLRVQLEETESEIERLRREVENLKKQQKKATALVDGERLRAEQALLKRGREERMALEQEAQSRAQESVDQALPATCPEELRNLVMVAERTFQNALHTEIPAAAVAVLFSGALERTLLECIVKPFDAFLEVDDRREQFLKAVLREDTGRRKEYSERAAYAFDRSRSSKPPGLGEILRLLERRNESHLIVFRSFLDRALALPESTHEALCEFVRWSKEKLRDPVAHGRLELNWAELKVFRRSLLFEFAAQPEGVLKTLTNANRVT
jgi:hypothetical protein